MKKDFDPKRLMKREPGYVQLNEKYFEKVWLMRKFEEWMASHQKQEGIPEEACFCVSFYTTALTSKFLLFLLLLLNFLLIIQLL